MTFRILPRQIARATRRTLIPPLVALLAVAALGVVAGLARDSAVQPGPPARVLLVVDESEHRDPALAERAAAALRGAERRLGVDGQLRVTHTPTEQLSVTRYFAAQGYAAIVGVGLDPRIAVAPVRRSYPDVRFVAAGERQLDTALARAAATS